MPAASSPLTPTAAVRLRELGARLRAQRKALGVSAVSAAEAAGMSRVTLYRIEKGEPSVSMGAYFNAAAALGLDLEVTPRSDQPETGKSHRPGWIPARIALTDYPQLRRLAWQVHGTDALTPIEAMDIYERNWRHVDEPAMTPAEKQLVAALRAAFREHA